MNAVISNVVPLVAQNLASKNSEIQDMALSVLDVFVEYLGKIYKIRFLFMQKKLINVLIKMVVYWFNHLQT
jgi:hypothetical protein